MGPHAPARAGRHGDLVVEPAAESLAPGSCRTAPGQHVHDLAHLACGRPELAEEPHLVRNRRGDAHAQARCGARQRSRYHGQKKLIEQAYTLGAQLGLSVWCEDEAGPFQAVPQSGVSWQPREHPAKQPHEYIRGGTTKILTLFHPASGQVRLQQAARGTNAVLHPWLREHLSAILAALPVPTASQDAAATQAAWAVWQAGLTRPFTLPHDLPPLRPLLVWDNLTGPKTPDPVLWPCAPGGMPPYTPVGGSWLNMAESIERVLKRRALDGQHPHSPAEIGSWFEQTAQRWNEQPTPFVWNGKRRQRRRRSGGDQTHRLGGSGACTHRPLRQNRATAASERQIQQQMTHQSIQAALNCTMPYHRFQLSLSATRLCWPGWLTR